MPNNKEGIGNPNQEWVRPTSEVSQEQQQYDIPHEVLVERFQNFIAQEDKRFRGALTPEQIIRWRLNNYSPNEREFYYPLARAFDAIAYEQYPFRSTDRSHALADVDYYCGQTSSTVVKLPNPVQIRVMDAITEALGIPYEKGQTEVPVPWKLQRFRNYMESDEYAQLLAEAEARKKQRQP